MYSFNVYTTPLNESYLKINKKKLHKPINNNQTSITISQNKINSNKKKKSLTWNNNVNVMITYSNDEYDRSIDSQTIRENQIKKMLNRLNDVPIEHPLKRGDTVFNEFTIWRR
tara:strand:+ start:41 stop:379 length:339 start_codon:yes stop_codon:yes gene_type:complete